MLHPWKRIFRDVFAIDEAAAALSGIRSGRATGKQPVGGSGLGGRCHERVPDYEAMLPRVCEALELPKRMALTLLPAPSSPLTPALPQVLFSGRLFFCVTPLDTICSCLIAVSCLHRQALQVSGAEASASTPAAGKKRALPSSPFAAGDADTESGPLRR